MSSPTTGRRPRHRTRSRRVAVLAVAAAGLTLLSALAVTSHSTARSRLATWADELATLRVEVEALDTRLRTERTQGLTRLRSLTRRKAELQLEQDRAGIRLTTARRGLAEVKKRLAESKQRRHRIVPVLSKALVALRGVVAQSLPFRRRERLQAIDELKAKIDAGRIEPETALSRLWRYIEDELKLASEVLRTRIPLRLSAKTGAPRRLVDVARLGMVTLYTRTKEGRIGQLRRDRSGTWRHVWLTDTAQLREVRRLFEALGKNLTEGAYRLPLPPVDKAASGAGEDAP